MDDLIHNLGKTYKEVELSLITSEKREAKFQYDRDFKKITILKERSIIDTQDYIGANLYITSNERVKDGDWYLAITYSINGTEIMPQRFRVGPKPCGEIPLGRKIIATTDLLVTDEPITGKDISRGHAIMVKEKDAYYKCLPCPSENFIKFFTENNLMPKALAEYVIKSNTIFKVSYEQPIITPNYDLKISEDNTISLANFEDFRKEYTASEMKKCYIEAVKHYIKFGIEPTDELAQDYLEHLKLK